MCATRAHVQSDSIDGGGSASTGGHTLTLPPISL